MHVPSWIDLDAFDMERIASVSAALGPQRFGELVVILGARLHDLARTIETSSVDARSVVPVLHQSRGSAASLGLVGLASAMSDIEALITTDPTYMRRQRIGDEATLAVIRTATRALLDAWTKASKNPLLQTVEFGTDHASGICIR